MSLMPTMRQICRGRQVQARAAVVRGFPGSNTRASSADIHASESWEFNLGVAGTVVGLECCSAFSMLRVSTAWAELCHRVVVVA